MTTDLSALTVPFVGVIEVAFDPVARFGSIHVRWQTLGLAAAIMVALVVGARLAARAQPEEASGDGPLRLDDLLYVAMGIVPGAVIGGRLVHALAYLDTYLADPGALLDPARGSLSLLGAVLGGTLSGAYIASLLEGTTRRWTDVAALPMLLVLGLGKLAQLLGGAGQGSAFDGPWALAYAGPGPWGSPLAGASAHPSQVYEAAWTLLGAAAVAAVLRGRSRETLRARLSRIARARGAPTGSTADGGRGGRVGARGAAWFPSLRPGELFLMALAWWLVGRALAAFTWADARIFGPLHVEHLIAAPVLVAIGVALSRQPVASAGVRAATR